MHWGAQLALNVAMAGAVVGGIATLLQYHKSELAGFLYGIMPVSFLYLYIYTWVTDRTQPPVFAWNAALGGVFWLFFVTVVGYAGLFGGLPHGAALALGLALAGALAYLHRRPVA